MSVEWPSYTDAITADGLVSMTEFAEIITACDITPSVFYDIGACSGAYTRAFKMYFPDTLAVMFEALTENVARWLHTPEFANCAVFPLVLGSQTARRNPFFVQKTNGIHGLHP